MVGRVKMRSLDPTQPFCCTCKKRRESVDVIVIHAQDGMSASAWCHCSELSLTPDHLKITLEMEMIQNRF